MLNSRILRAATMVCGTPDARDLPAVAATNKCKSNALAQAQTRVTIAIAASQPNVQIATAR
jgi:UrcA family protein